VPLLSTQCPRQTGGPTARAFAEALEFCEPVFVPASIYADDRGWSIMNQMQGVLSGEGQINYSVQYPNVIKAWHRHQQQTDFWMCVLGNLKVGVYREEDDRAWSIVLGERRPGLLIIPPTLWHGATAVGAAQAGLLYYVNRAYCPQTPDEERRPAMSVKGFPWQVQNR
jgi:dTDP-4-dehydrorhamnose 3,5-epimerase